MAYIGPKIDYTYPINHLGINNTILFDIIQGKHHFCKQFKKAKNPIIIVGTNYLYQNNESNLILEKFKNLSFINSNNINILHTQSSFLNFNEIFNKKYNFEKMDSNLYYLYNTDFIKNINFLKKKDFVIYQGHHFNIDAQTLTLIRCSSTQLYI